MSRQPERKAWPFDQQGHKRDPGSPQEFVKERRDGTEAVVIRIGGHDAQLVLVDGAGDWTRWVYPSVDEAKAVAETLDVPVHVGEYPEELRVRMNSHVRPQQDFDSGAYPEQGHVGPVIPYPENRPRHVDQAVDERRVGTSPLSTG
ncbi:MAG: hypothetical protein M3290_09725 [Actinomycetota bacterium]|nr:hypothetical protein [Actinomycetota bacterium]